MGKNSLTLWYQLIHLRHETTLVTSQYMGFTCFSKEEPASSHNVGFPALWKNLGAEVIVKLNGRTKLLSAGTSMAAAIRHTTQWLRHSYRG